MADKTKFLESDKEQRSRFVQHLLNDLQAMEIMWADDIFEHGVQRIGVEQEFCLIDYSLRPAMLAMEVLEKINDDHFTTELAKFNLEANLDPVAFSGNCFSTVENDLIRLLTKANRTAHKLGAKIILSGILPTIRNSDLVMENITPNPRYKALNDAIYESRGDDFKFNIQGVDELIAVHDNVLFESCNTSFQVHLQIEPTEFISQYNWAQAIAGPVLSAATNSPLLLGKRLWQETRIALFNQSADVRKSTSPLREEWPRVSFGKDWVKQSPIEIFRENISRYKVLLSPAIEEDALEELQQGKTPRLKALSFHNGTIYKWNRPCYGVTNGKPHIRIESRYFPAGPTIVDEVANAAFWLGTMKGMPDKYREIKDIMDFDDAKFNFLEAARAGLGAQFKWTKGKLIPAKKLILKELLPIARQGLDKVDIDEKDKDKYLGIIEERVKAGKTGSRWILDAFTKLRKEGSSDEAIIATTEGIYQRQKIGQPVHHWELPKLEEGGDWSNRYKYIQQLMSTDLITVLENEPLELVKNIMLWSNIRHMPVENTKGHLVGLITTEHIVFHSAKEDVEEFKSVMVGEVMIKDPVAVTPTTLTIEAVKIMRKHEVGCLPVIEQNKLVGIFTERDYLKIAEYIKHLEDDEGG